MSFLDIKDPAERAILVKEYVTAMKTVKQRNMANQELKLAIGDELQILFHPIVNATEKAAEETRKELKPMKKTLADIDGALAVQRATEPPLEESKGESARKRRAYNQTGRTFGVFKTKDGHPVMGDKVVRVGLDGENIYVEGEMYHLTPGLNALITYRQPKHEDYADDEYATYRALIAQTNVKTKLIHAGARDPYNTWKWNHMLVKMFTPLPLSDKRK